MNITGQFDESDRGQSASGAFYVGAKNATARGDNNGSAGHWCMFDASRSWSGATSSNGAHTHTLTTSSVTDFSVFGKSDTVQPNALKCRVKTRFI